MTHLTLTCLAIVLAGRAGAQTIDTLPVRVDGRRVHMVSAGHGSPTVVLEAGFSGTSRIWSRIQSDLARTHRVVSYDRAGLGGSDASPRPRTGRVIAEELRAALRSAGIEPPYLLVGYSAGGLYVRAFAGAYPRDVVGLVLVDPAPEDFYARAKREFPRVYAYFDSVDAADVAGASAGDRAEADAWDSVLADAREADARYQGRAILLSSTRADLRELGAVWADEQRRWAQRDRRREYVLLEGVGHAIPRERPDAVLGAIRRLLASVPRRP